MKNKIAFLILRIGLGVVFLIFGIGKFQHDYWARTIETMDLFMRLPWSSSISVIIIGILEVLTGACLILGLFTRIVSALAALQLSVILFLLGFQEVRDIGLLAAAVFMSLTKDNSCGIDWFVKNYAQSKR